MIPSNEVTEFIQHFSGSEETFLHGCCYWFAYILRQRFGFQIVYEPIEGHFLARERAGRTQYEYYDIRGIVTPLYRYRDVYDVEWLRKNEPRWYQRIMRDCRDFIRPSDEELNVSA